MQIVHKAKDPIPNMPGQESTIHILFSTDKKYKTLTKPEDAIINNFFTNIDWKSSKSDTADLLGLGNLMEILNFKDRYVYQGSLTAPPCTSEVYVNVLKTIYYISQEHIEMLKKHLA